MTEHSQTTSRFDCIKLSNQLCFPLYACAKEVIRQYRGPLEELGLTYTQYVVMMVLWEFGGMTEGNERKLYISLTAQGEALKEKAILVPPAMQGCIDLSQEELMELKRLLDKALLRMEAHT